MELKGSLELNNHSEILPLNDLEIFVPSLNQEEKIEWKRVIECSRHKHQNNIIKIKTNSGREITCTNNHSFVTRANNSVVPIKGSDLKIGDRIPVINNFFSDHYLKEITISENIEDKEITIKEEILYKPGTITKAIRNNIVLDGLSGWYTGAYLSEGANNGSSVGISNVDDNYNQKAKNFAMSLDIAYVDRRCQDEYWPGRMLFIYSTPLAKFIENTCGTGSDFKKVPQFAYSASDEFISGLLKGYFDGDGNFHVDRDLIRASSNSKELIDGVALLLTRFKIFSYKTKDKKGQYWLLIPYKYAPLFLMNVGSSIEHKKIAREKLAEKAKIFLNEKSQDYNDMISGFDSLFYDVAKKLDYPTRYINNFTKRQKIGRTALFRHMKIFENIAKEKNIDIKNELKIMNRMFYSDIVWDSIEKIEYIDNEDYVYDLSVPGLETFTTFDGIITHNTLNVFHFAGVAEVAVTLGLPRLIEILDARKEIATPLIDVFIEKPDNKDADRVKKIAASLKETKLGEISSEFGINIAKLQIEVVLNKQAMRDFGVTEKSL